jgi:hypothetical protein
VNLIYSLLDFTIGNEKIKQTVQPIKFTIKLFTWQTLFSSNEANNAFRLSVVSSSAILLSILRYIVLGSFVTI